MFRSFVFCKGKTREESNADTIIGLLKEEGSVVWIDIEDPSETEIEMLIDRFNFHPLSIEDAIFPQDHPKIEEFEEYVFLTLFGIRYEKTIITQEVNIFYGKNYVITFHEQKINAINKLLNKFVKMAASENGQGKIADCSKGSDVLLHSVLDTIVDEYFFVVEKLEITMAQLEDRVLEEKDEKLMEDTLDIKRNLLVMRKFISQERAIVNRFAKGELPFLHKNTKMYFNDVYDHISSVQEEIEILREVVPSFIESYYSMHSKKLNQSIHRLTILATIALPVVAITSYYGQNLALPEIKWGIWGVLFMWGLIIFSSLATYLFLKWKKWL